MKKLILILFVFLLSKIVLAEYQFIEPPDNSLPECQKEDGKIISIEKCIGLYENPEEDEKFEYYIGEFENGEYNGNGKLVFSGNASYEGTFVNGLMDGYGKFIYDSGIIYVGDWFKNHRHGNGVLFWPDGTKYIGEFKLTKQHGEAYYIYPNGDINKATWKNNKSISKTSVKRPNYREYNSRTGVSFNHYNHLGSLTEDQISAFLEIIPDWMAGIFIGRPAVDRQVFIDTNFQNLLIEESMFDTLIIEYDTVENYEGIRLVMQKDWESLDDVIKFCNESMPKIYKSDQPMCQTYLLEDKYPGAFFDQSGVVHENRFAWNIVARVNDNYYTIGYTSNFTNDEEYTKKFDQLNSFVSSIKFNEINFKSSDIEIDDSSSKKNEASNNTNEKKISDDTSDSSINSNPDGKKVEGMFGIKFGSVPNQSMNPTEQEFTEWAGYKIKPIDSFPYRVLTVIPPIINQEFIKYMVHTTPETNKIVFIDALSPRMESLDECKLKQMTIRNHLMNVYENDFEVNDNVTDDSTGEKTISMYMNNNEGKLLYTFYINCWRSYILKEGETLSKSKYDGKFTLGLKVRDENLSESAYKEVEVYKINQKIRDEEAERKIFDDNVDLTGM